MLVVELQKAVKGMCSCKTLPVLRPCKVGIITVGKQRKGAIDVPVQAEIESAFILNGSCISKTTGKKSVVFIGIKALDSR